MIEEIWVQNGFQISDKQVQKIVTVETDGHQTNYNIQKDPINLSLPNLNNWSKT